MPRSFNPPLTYEEIDRVYQFTTRVLNQLGLPQWRMQIRDSPCHRNCYATIEPQDDKYVGELSLSASWMAIDLEAERIQTLVHECLHLTHAELTRQVSDRAIEFIPVRLFHEFDTEWRHAIELWVDHMTQFTLWAMKIEIAEWAAEIWGEDWKEQGSSRAPRG